MARMWLHDTPMSGQNGRSESSAPGRVLLQALWSRWVCFLPVKRMLETFGERGAVRCDAKLETIC